MEITVFSNGKNPLKCFSAIKKRHAFSVFPVSEMKKTVKKGTCSFIYLDLWNISEAEFKRHLKFLSCQDEAYFGIIDPKGIIKDVSPLFFSGAADYIGKDLYSKGVSAARFKAVMDFIHDETLQFCTMPSEVQKYIFSGDSWKGIQAGNEYTFLFMYIELGNKFELQKMGSEYSSRILEQYKQYISDIVTPYNGKIWMWTDYQGLLLFPFNGKESPAVIAALKLILDSRIASSELFNLDFTLAYRIVMLIGNTVYKSRGDTGAIVSDSLNTIFHLGQKYAIEAGFYVTKEAFRFVPRGLGHLFVDADEYDGRAMMKMISLN